jgi:hypothetical protein
MSWTSVQEEAMRMSRSTVQQLEESVGVEEEEEVDGAAAGGDRQCRRGEGGVAGGGGGKEKEDGKVRTVGWFVVYIA